MDVTGLFNTDRYSDMLIKFSGREIKAHRFVLCETSTYFAKLCGTNSEFMEAKELEVTLQDDDPDAAEAMLHHLYSFTLKSPTFKEKLDQVRFYCNVVVASDKYGIPKLAEEAALHLQNHLVKVLVPEDVVASLKIVTEEYGGYKSLKSCVSSQVQGRMQQLASVPGFSVLLASEPRLLGELVADAMQFRTLKSINRYGCHFCGANLLSDTGRSPRCCNNTMGSRTPAYIAKFP